MKRLFIIGDDEFMVQAMRFALRYTSGVSLFGVVDGHGSLRQAVREADPDLVAIDGVTEPALGPDARRAGPRGGARRQDPAAHRRRSRREAMEQVLDAGRDGLRLPGPADPRHRRASARRRRAAAPSPSAPCPSPWAGRRCRRCPRRRPPAPVLREPEPCPLTNRELEILKAVAEGHTNARIGRSLWVTEQTVKFHLSNIYRKLGVANRTEASRYALMNGLFGPVAGHPGAGRDAAARGGDERRTCACRPVARRWSRS